MHKKIFVAVVAISALCIGCAPAKSNFQQTRYAKINELLEQYEYASDIDQMVIIGREISQELDSFLAESPRQSESTYIVKRLSKLLKPNNYGRAFAARQLSKFGSEASIALPDVREALRLEEELINNNNFPLGPSQTAIPELCNAYESISKSLPNDFAICGENLAL